VEELNKFLKSNPDVKCEKKEPIYISEKYIPINDSQIKYLTESEIKTYLDEMENERQIKKVAYNKQS